MKNAPNLELSLLARQWGASAVPFGELSAEAWLETPPSERALALLDQTATLRSVMLLAGPNGVGKSALVGRWLHRLDRRLFCPLLLTHASLSGCGLLSALAAKLGKRATFRREANLALIEAALAELGKVVPLILLDEAQSFAYSSLEEVRLLLGLNLADPPAFGLVLIGDEYLLGTLRLRQHRSLSLLAHRLPLEPGPLDGTPGRSIRPTELRGGRHPPSGDRAGRPQPLDQRQQRAGPQPVPALPRRLDRSGQHRRSNHRTTPRASGH